jgi:hypothetical protein
MILTRRAAVAAMAAGPLIYAASAGAAAPPPIHVVKSPTCGCCNFWVAHLRRAGFQVRVTDVADVTPTARRLGVPDELRSCHTASVGGYAIEGHVPAADILRLLRQRPAAAGLAVPGMPMGSPGMEAGGRGQPYQVIVFTRAGRRAVFAQH